MSDCDDDVLAARGALGVAGAALPTAMTTVIAPDANPTFHLTMLHLNAATTP
jgi:hypothetical protein